jgi:hypothetical protein
MSGHSLGSGLRDTGEKVHSLTDGNGSGDQNGKLSFSTLEDFGKKAAQSGRGIQDLLFPHSPSMPHKDPLKPPSREDVVQSVLNEQLRSLEKMRGINPLGGYTDPNSQPDLLTATLFGA